MLQIISLFFCLIFYVRGDYVELFDDNTVQIVSNLNDSTAPVVSNNADVFAADDTLWGLDRINQEYGRDGVLSTGNPVSAIDILVFDTGIDKTHPEFVDTVFLPGLDYFVFDDPFTPECSTHGTSVASLIVGKNTGIVAGARVQSVRVMNCRGVGNVYSVIRAIDLIIKRKPTRKTIVVMAFTTGEPNLALRVAANRLASLDNVIVLSAAGNGAQDACEVSPSNARRVLAVGHTTINDEMNENSNFGECVDFFMPGTSVRAAKMAPSDFFEKELEETNLYRAATGSSFAVAYAAGVVAFKWNVRSSFKSARMRGFLRTTQSYTIPNCETGKRLPTLTLLSPLLDEPIDYASQPLGFWGDKTISRSEFNITCMDSYCVFIFGTRPNSFDSCNDEWFRVSMWLGKYQISFGNKTVVPGVVINGTISVTNPYEGNLFYTSSTSLFLIN